MNARQQINIAELSVDERLDLIEALWGSLEDKDIPVTDMQRAEIELHLETFDADLTDAITLEALKAELNQRHL
jgi:putative addiction module component (TIGR02574 family)